jgi:pectinesterase
VLARHHQEAQFYLLDCTFSKSMTDKPPKRVIYPIGDKPATEDDIKKNAELDKTNLWGERAFFHNCHRDGGDYTWHADNLSTASGAPTADQITAAWTFRGTWDPKRTAGPKIRQITRDGEGIRIEFDEAVTVRGKPRVMFADGNMSDYVSGSGTTALLFARPPSRAQVRSLDLIGGHILASEASASLRRADVAHLPD